MPRGPSAAAAGRFASGAAGIAVLAALTTAAAAATPGPAAARGAAPVATPGRTYDPDRYELTGRAAPARQLSELLAAGYGRPIRAAADGVIAYAGPRGGYGKLIIVRHPGGITTRYGHMSRILVRSGPVRAGQVIALEGAEGDATGPHLHFEVRLHRPAGKPDRGTGADTISSAAHGVDVPIDPIPFLAAHGIVIGP